MRCTRVYLTLFKNHKILEREGGMQKPYLYNDALEGDKFGLDIEAEEDDEEEKK